MVRDALAPSVRLLPDNAEISNCPLGLIVRAVATVKAVPLAVAVVAVLAMSNLPNPVATAPPMSGAAPVNFTVLVALAVNVPADLVHVPAPVPVTVSVAAAERVIVPALWLRLPMDSVAGNVDDPLDE